MWNFIVYNFDYQVAKPTETGAITYMADALGVNSSNKSSYNYFILY